MSEQSRIDENYASPDRKWLHWGPYLSERQWGTVREDYSPDGDAWGYLPHDHARSRAYRWGEDGLAGISDVTQRLCFALALWNGKDPILKERLYGLTGPEGNHAEDVKELYFYLDNTPTHAYMKYLYKYPQAAFPYEELVSVNEGRSKHEPEYEILDTGLFDEGKYFDVFVEYAKADHEDILIKITVENRGPDAVTAWVLPTLWYRNLWSFGYMEDKPSISQVEVKEGFHLLKGAHEEIGDHYLYCETADKILFTENETNTERLFEEENEHPYVKDAFHTAIIEDDFDLLEKKTEGSKCAPMYQIALDNGESKEIRLRLSRRKLRGNPLGKGFTDVFNKRVKEADEFYQQKMSVDADPEIARIQRQAFAGMMWTKQYYHIDIPIWLHGDPGQPKPPESRLKGRNSNWKYLNNEDIISMPDKWEYPWYAVWDLAFHCVPIAMIDPDFAKHQLILMLREWYMHPNGQIPAYEWNFGDVNPPVHAWASLKVYEIEKKQKGKGDIDFLKRVFQKLMLNFTWWVNRKDSDGNNVFEGGFLGLDNIGVFDRSKGLPGGGVLEQADGTSWMATYSLNMMQMALEISQEDSTFEDVATKFFEHFIYIAETLNNFGADAEGLWDEDEGFYYDQIHLPDGSYLPIKVRSLVGLSTLFAVCIVPKSVQEKVPEFMERKEWFKKYRKEMGKKPITFEKENGDVLMAMVPKNRLLRLLEAMLDEHEFLGPGGIRSLSRKHAHQDYVLNVKDQYYSLRYEAGESSTYMFGGNSNWRGPIWFPMNYMLIQSLYTYCHFFDGKSKTEYPTGSGKEANFTSIADDISRRLINIFVPDQTGHRPVNGDYTIFSRDPHFKDLVLFYEYFHGDNSRGVGASHQTGWTGLVAELIDKVIWKNE
ncbi:MAG: glucosidase [Bacteroidota bacterium]